MLTIMEYEVSVVDPQPIYMPTGAELLGVYQHDQELGKTPIHILLAAIETTNPSAMRRIDVVHSGMEIHEDDHTKKVIAIRGFAAVYIGTVSINKLLYHFLDGGYE